MTTAAAIPTHTADEKHRQLRMRKERLRKLGTDIDSLMRRAEGGDAPVGCRSGLCAWLRRRFGQGSEAAIAASLPTPGSGGTHSNVELHRAVFGLAGAKRSDPAAKLDEAAQVMRARIAQLEERVLDQRKVAESLMRAGRKTQAMRELKKVKAVELQVDANQASLMAVEQQVDMLAQAAMQKTLALALATTSKTMKKDAKMLGKAEAAIEDAHEAREVATDLDQVMAEFAGAGAGHVDDDELLGELEGMMAENADRPPFADAAAIERETSEAHSAAVAAMPSTPHTSLRSGVQKVRGGEKAGLLASVA